MPTIPQPPLRPATDSERIVRTAGLQFILPCPYRTGHVLTEDDAAFINAAHHTAVINSFSAVRQLLLENPNCTYDDIDQALQAHCEEYRRKTRTTSTPKPPTKSDELKALITFARPHFNDIVRTAGLKWDRAEYEAQLLLWVETNTPMLREMQSNARTLQAKLISKLPSML